LLLLATRKTFFHESYSWLITQSASQSGWSRGIMKKVPIGWVWYIEGNEMTSSWATLNLMARFSQNFCQLLCNAVKIEWRHFLRIYVNFCKVVWKFIHKFPSILSRGAQPADFSGLYL
jgi:hypothetical protein